MKRVLLGELLEEVADKTTVNNQYPVLTSSKSGLFLQSDYFNKQVASKNNVGYKIIKKGQFTYRAMSDTGEFFPNMLECTEIGIVSPAYPVFKNIKQNEVTNEFLKYYFKSGIFQNAVSRFAQGSTRTSVKFGKLKTITIELPRLEEQTQIVAKLKKLDHLIGLQQQQISLIEDVVKSRFIELFGDLKSNSKGWDIKTFDELTELITDGEHATPRRTDKGIYLLSARNILNHSIQLEDVDFIDQEEYDRIAKRVIPQEGDVLISCSGTVGRCCSVPADLKFQMVRSAAVLRFKEEINPIFAEYMITSDYLQEQINSSKTASSQANLFQGKIKALKGFVPPMDLQNEFLAFVKQVDKSKHFSELEVAA